MNNIQKALSKKGCKLIPYLMAGYPNKKDFSSIVFSAIEAGSNMIEIGIPFSDPLADGPIIQAAGQQAIKNGVSIRWIISETKKIKKKSTIPIILMGYINPIIKYGLSKFIYDCKSAEIDGLIIPDLPPGECEEIRSLCMENNISLIMLIAPNTSDERIKYISNLSPDLVYCVSILGVTGTKKVENKKLINYLKRVKKNCNSPFIVGFGVKDSNDVKNINKISNGAVIGSELIRRISASKNPKEECYSFIKGLKK